MKHEFYYDLIDGCALLEYLGNLYEYIGEAHGKHVFQNVNDDSHIEVTSERLLHSKEFSVQY